MFKFTLKAPKYTLRRGFSETFQAKMSAQVRNAAREFVAEAILKIPIDTGQARGTFLPLGRFLHVAVSIPGADPTDNKSPSSGAGADKQLLFQFTETKTGITFEIDTQLFYFWFNDFYQNKYNHHEQWGSIQAGWTAFMEYMREVAPTRLPKLKDFISVTMEDYTR